MVLTEFISSAKGRLACEPFKTNAVEVEFDGGIVRTVQKETVTELMLVFDAAPDADLRAGDSVFIRSDRARSMWGKEIFHVDNLDFILVPLEEVLLVRRCREEEETGVRR